MKELGNHAKDVDAAGEEILTHFLENMESRTIYYDGWNGFGTAAVLTSISRVIQSMEPRPPELHFGRTIYIDCTVWKSKRVMQRKIAEELKLDQKIMVMFDKQDEEDDFNGVAHGSRDVIRKVSAMIYRSLREFRFMMIFLNGSDDELVLSRFGIPEYEDCLIIWTFRRQFLAMHDYDDRKTRDKLRYTDLFISENYPYSKLESSELRALFSEEAATIFAHYTYMQDVNPTMATNYCLYGLFLHHALHGTTRFGWAAQTPNLYICDGIHQVGRAREISDVLDPKIAFECDASILEYMYRRLLHEDPDAPSLVIKDDDVFYERPYRWISVTSKNKEVLEDMQKVLARASSVFLVFERTNSPTGLPNGLFKQCSKLGVLILSYCAFSFVSPPFLHCDTLRFLGLEHCTDSTVELEGDSTTKWTCLHSLSALNLRYTDWDEILSEEMIALMVNLLELSIEGVECWQYTSKLQEWLPNLERLRIIKPMRQAEASADINNSFMNKAKLEILDLSCNSDMNHLPTSLSKARRLQRLVLDGCDGLESVVLPKSSLRSFSFDGYGLASNWTSTLELPTKCSSFKPSNANKKDVKTSKISLEGCTHLENLFLRGLHNLVELDLSGCVLIKVLDLVTMIVDVPRLKRLFLLGCENLHAINWGLDTKSDEWIRIQNFPMELELLCIDTRLTGTSQLRSSLALAQKSFRLQVHAVTADARLARSLWAPIHYYLQDNENDVYFNISISSSAALHGEAIQPEAATSKEMNQSCCHQQQGHGITSTGLYGDVFDKVSDLKTPMHAFPQPPTGQLDHHVDIGYGSLNVESEMVIDFDHCNLSDLMRTYTQSLHVHDASTSITTPGGSWFSLKSCRVERCPNLDTVFKNLGGEDKLDCLENIWASDLLRACSIWKQGYQTTFPILRHLHLRSCPSLQYALPVCEDSMPSLETLHVMHCGNLRHIFVLGTDNLDSVLFPQLTNIQLHDLPALEQISEFKMITLRLKTIKIRGCWSLRRLPCTGYSWWGPPAVEVEKDTWDALEWDALDDRHHPSLYQTPVHSRYYKRRMLKGTVLR